MANTLVPYINVNLAPERLVVMVVMGIALHAGSMQVMG